MVKVEEGRPLGETLMSVRESERLSVRPPCREYRNFSGHRRGEKIGGSLEYGKLDNK